MRLTIHTRSYQPLVYHQKGETNRGSTCSSLNLIRFIDYLSSTEPPASSILATSFSASPLETASLMAFGAPSTRALASFKTKTCRFANSLDNSDFLRTCAGKHNVELGLFFCGSSFTATSSRTCSNCNSCSSTHAPLLLKLVGQLLDLKDSKIAQPINTWSLLNHSFRFSKIFKIHGNSCRLFRC